MIFISKIGDKVFTEPLLLSLSSEQPTWCGATKSEWADLYESAINLDD